MYSTCLSCHHALGGNEMVVAFPIGRRLAFDPAKGRFWVVCPSCGRWNLAPLDERWEAIEQCERLFLSAHLSVLEHAWKEAEEIAAIADDLLLPEWIRIRVGG